MLVWTVLDGPVFMASSRDRTVKLCMGIIVAITIIDMVVKLRRSVSPAARESA